MASRGPLSRKWILHTAALRNYSTLPSQALLSRIPVFLQLLLAGCWAMTHALHARRRHHATQLHVWVAR